MITYNFYDLTLIKQKLHYISTIVWRWYLDCDCDSLSIKANRFDIL